MMRWYSYLIDCVKKIYVMCKTQALMKLYVKKSYRKKDDEIFIETVL